MLFFISAVFPIAEFHDHKGNIFYPVILPEIFRAGKERTTA
jgi:hypothetical protein